MGPPRRTEKRSRPQRCAYLGFIYDWGRRYVHGIVGDLYMRQECKQMWWGHASSICKSGSSGASIGVLEMHGEVVVQSFVWGGL